MSEYLPIRQDICEAFGVPLDEDHIILFDPHAGSTEKNAKQRAFRCFYIVIDSRTREAFYSEGRTIHNILLSKIIKRMIADNPNLTEDTIYEMIDTDPPEIMVFKGFMSTDKFSDLSDDHRQLQEQALYNSEGAKVDTAADWFISGHNLPEPEKHT